MSPERAKVFVVEDNEKWQEMIKMRLENSGHQVVLSATSLTDALAGAEKLTELGIQVATIDANLNAHDTDGNDGQSVLEAIRKLAPQVKTIGLSGLYVKGVDVDLGKTKVVDLGKTVTDI